MEQAGPTEPPVARLRIGVIGTGFGVRVHVPGFRESGDFEVVGIVSHGERRAREVAEREGIAHAFTDHRALLALPGLDAVSVASTPDRHAEHLIDALAAGKHVLCEKPLAHDVADARRMAAAAHAAAAHGQVAMIDHELRWQPARRHVKELLDAGFVGAPYLVTAVDHIGLFADPERPPHSWWHEAARGGGWLLNSGTHLVDTLRWWLGDVERVAGFTRTHVAERRRAKDGARVPVDADDAFGALLRFRSGVDAVVQQSAVGAAGRTSLVEIHGSAGMLRLDAQGRLAGAPRGAAEPTTLDIHEHLLAGAPRTDAAPQATPPLPGADAAATTAALRNLELPPFVCLARTFAAAIRAGRAAEPSVVDAARTMEVCDAIARSAREGRWIALGP